MQINGKEINMRYSVRARLKIAALCPDKKITNMGMLFTGTEEETVDALAKIGVILNNEYEAYKRKENGEAVSLEENYALFSYDDVLDLTSEGFTELEGLVTSTMFGDALQTVEAAEPKEKGKKKET